VRDAGLRLGLTHDALDLLRVRAAALLVDVEAVRLGVKHLHIRTELLESKRAGVGGRAMRVVERDAHAVERTPSIEATA
jgi:hypothetical protein